MLIFLKDLVKDLYLLTGFTKRIVEMFYGQHAMSPEVTSAVHLEGRSKTFRDTVVKVSRHTQPLFRTFLSTVRMIQA